MNTAARERQQGPVLALQRLARGIEDQLCSGYLVFDQQVVLHGEGS